MDAKNCSKETLPLLGNSVKLLLLLFVFGFFQCRQATKVDEYSGMLRFVNDATFRNSHQKPISVILDSVGSMEQYLSEDGSKQKAYFIKKENAKKTLLVFHEWWGLNDNIKMKCQSLATEIADANILGLDLYNGQVAATPDDASNFMKLVQYQGALDNIQGAINHFAKDQNLATIGWCFGGGWSLQVAIMAGNQVKACVVYYGMPEMDAKKLVNLKAPVLGLFAEKDAWITPEVVENFDDVMKALGKDFKHYSFPAEHAFANPSGSRYNQEEATKANKIALDFLKHNF